MSSGHINVVYGPRMPIDWICMSSSTMCSNGAENQTSTASTPT